jgi:hypothetical protein
MCPHPRENRLDTVPERLAMIEAWQRDKGRMRHQVRYIPYAVVGCVLVATVQQRRQFDGGYVNSLVVF